MLNLFRRRDEGRGSRSEGTPGPSLSSHILAKFLKRLRTMQRAHLLDLGRVSGPNIEFFAQAGCRVRVEDILDPGGSAVETEATEPSPMEKYASSRLRMPRSAIIRAKACC